MASTESQIVPAGKPAPPTKPKPQQTWTVIYNETAQREFLADGLGHVAWIPASDPLFFTGWEPVQDNKGFWYLCHNNADSQWCTDIIPPDAPSKDVYASHSAGSMEIPSVGPTLVARAGGSTLPLVDQLPPPVVAVDKQLSLEQQLMLQRARLEELQRQYESEREQEQLEQQRQQELEQQRQQELQLRQQIGQQRLQLQLQPRAPPPPAAACQVPPQEQIVLAGPATGGYHRGMTTHGVPPLPGMSRARQEVPTPKLGMCPVRNRNAPAPAINPSGAPQSTAALLAPAPKADPCLAATRPPPRVSTVGMPATLAGAAPQVPQPVTQVACVTQSDTWTDRQTDRQMKSTVLVLINDIV